MSSLLKEIKNLLNAIECNTEDVKESYFQDGAEDIAPVARLQFISEEMEVLEMLTEFGYNTQTEDIKSNEDSVLPVVTINMEAFDIARLGKDELYSLADAEYSKIGIEIEIKSMDLTPFDINSNGTVCYKVYPKEFLINNCRNYEIFDKSIQALVFEEGEKAHIQERLNVYYSDEQNEGLNDIIADQFNKLFGAYSGSSYSLEFIDTIIERIVATHFETPEE